MSSYKDVFKVAFPKTIPILFGYLFLGCGFRSAFGKKRISLLWTTFTASTVYSGSMQYVAVDLLNKPFSIFNAVIMTLAVNIRHVFYGLSLIEKYKGIGAKKYTACSV